MTYDEWKAKDIRDEYEEFDQDSNELDSELETCADRNYTCCDSLTPEEHFDEFGYYPSGYD